MNQAINVLVHQRISINKSVMVCMGMLFLRESDHSDLLMKFFSLWYLGQTIFIIRTVQR